MRGTPLAFTIVETGSLIPKNLTIFAFCAILLDETRFHQTVFRSARSETVPGVQFQTSLVN